VVTTNWANVLSWARLFSIIPLTLFAYLQATAWFVALYVFAILTDFFDGKIARTQGLASAKGAELDGTIDLVFAAAGLLWLYFIAPHIYSIYWPHLLVVAGVFIAFFSASVWKVGRVVMPHLWLGKLSMALFSLLVPAVLFFGVIGWMVWSVLIVVVMSRLEMIIFVLRGREDLDARSVFF